MLRHKVNVSKGVCRGQIQRLQTRDQNLALHSHHLGSSPPTKLRFQLLCPGFQGFQERRSGSARGEPTSNLTSLLRLLSDSFGASSYQLSQIQIGWHVVGGSGDRWRRPDVLCISKALPKMLDRILLMAARKWGHLQYQGPVVLKLPAPGLSVLSSTFPL